MGNLAPFGNIGLSKCTNFSVNESHIRYSIVSRGSTYIRSSLYWQLELSSDLLPNSVPESENIDSTLFDDFCMHSLAKSRLDLESVVLIRNKPILSS